MRAVRRQGTKPELAVRCLLREIGVRYRVSNDSLPGSPDLANRARGWAIFVHGCFWHGHPNCAKTKGGRRGRIPRQNRPFWAAKIMANRKRDAQKARELTEMGFRVLVVWECELRSLRKLRRRLDRSLGPRSPGKC